MTSPMAHERAAFEGSALPIVIMDPRSFRFLDCNPAAARFYGLGSVAETLGKCPADVSAPLQYDGRPSAEKAREYIEQALRDGAVAFEWLHQRPDGERRDAEVHLSRLTVGGEGLLQFTLVDITERVQAVQALRASEAQYRFLTESMKDVVWALDVEAMRFVYVSPSVQRLRGYTPEEVMAAPADAALTPEAAAKIRGFLVEYLARFEKGQYEAMKDSFFTEEVPQPRKDGSLVWTEVITSFGRNPRSGKVELHGVTRDIT